VRITPVSWLIVLAGAVAFGGGIVGLARVLPSDSAPRNAASYAGTSPLPPEVQAPAPPDATATPKLGPPPASRAIDAPLERVTALDFRPVDAGMRDRYGNAPKRAATAGELQAIAVAHDVIVDDLRWQPDGAALEGSQIAEMKAANPRLRVLRYVGALTNNDGPIFNIAPEQDDHGSWFLRDGSGDFVRAYDEIAVWNRQPSYVFDPSSVDVRNMIGAWARQFSMLGYDGVLLDGVSACVPVAGSACAAATLLSSPLDKTTNRPYTGAAWLDATTGLLAAVRRSAPNAQIFVASTAGDPAELTGCVDGVVVLSQ
jgi:hypothetical protein